MLAGFNIGATLVALFNIVAMEINVRTFIFGKG